MSFIFRTIFNLGRFVIVILLLYLAVFVILRGLRWGLEQMGYEVKDFTSWMTQPIRDFIEWRKSRKK